MKTKNINLTPKDSVISNDNSSIKDNIYNSPSQLQLLSNDNLSIKENIYNSPSQLQLLSNDNLSIKDNIYNSSIKDDNNSNTIYYSPPHTQLNDINLEREKKYELEIKYELERKKNDELEKEIKYELERKRKVKLEKERNDEFESKNNFERKNSLTYYNIPRVHYNPNESPPNSESGTPIKKIFKNNLSDSLVSSHLINLSKINTKLDEHKNNYYMNTKEFKSKNGIEFKKINNMTPLWGALLTLQENLNIKIGTQIWKKYINAAFWNYISTPINFIITLFTALSAGQTGSTTSFLSQNQLFYLLFVSFILSTINTFFKLKDKASLNYDSLKKYEAFGTRFEVLYYSIITNENELFQKYLNYLELQKDINDYISDGNIENVNYVTEILFIIVKNTIIRNKNIKRIIDSERYWVFDGKPSFKYKNKFPIDMTSLYDYDFNINDINDICHKKNNDDIQEVYDNNSHSSSPLDIEKSTSLPNLTEPKLKSNLKSNNDYNDNKITKLYGLI
jgi:hypothetical protein